MKPGFGPICLIGQRKSSVWLTGPSKLASSLKTSSPLLTWKTFFTRYNMNEQQLKYLLS